MLDHRPSNGQLRTIEALAKHTLPSSNEESLAAVILGKIPTLGLKKHITELPVEFCELLISVWAKCFDEKYVWAMLLSVMRPMYCYTNALVSFILCFSSSTG